MKAPNRWLWLSCAAIAACGDSSSAAGGDLLGSGDVAVAADTAAGADDAQGLADGAGPTDTGTGAPDTAAADSTGTPDGASADAQPGDDGGVPDADEPDAPLADTGVTDSGAVDTGPADTGTADTGPADTGPADTGAPDGGDDLDPPGPLPSDLGLPPLGFLPFAPLGATSTACATTSWWWGGDIGSDSMRPGGPCIDCHLGNDGPEYTFAGTVMAGYAEDDECRGIPAVTVEILDASGNVALTMESNGAGNFFSRDGGVEMPYSVRMTYAGRVREMTTQTYNGDCNYCHAQTGIEDAPGRIVLP